MADGQWPTAVVSDPDRASLASVVAQAQSAASTAAAPRALVSKTTSATTGKTRLRRRTTRVTSLRNVMATSCAQTTVRAHPPAVKPRLSVRVCVSRVSVTLAIRTRRTRSVVHLLRARMKRVCVVVVGPAAPVSTATCRHSSSTESVADADCWTQSCVAGVCEWGAAAPQATTNINRRRLNDAMCSRGKTLCPVGLNSRAGGQLSMSGYEVGIIPLRSV